MRQTLAWTVFACLLAVAGCGGDEGPMGTKGDQGEPGIQGQPGEKGDPGLQGDKGDTGEPGAKGDTGDQGPQGDPGPKGDAGDPGPKGDKGDTGAQGLTGERGPQGEPGDPAILAAMSFTPAPPFADTVLPLDWVCSFDEVHTVTVPEGARLLLSGQGTLEARDRVVVSFAIAYRKVGDVTNGVLGSHVEARLEIDQRTPVATTELSAPIAEGSYQMGHCLLNGGLPLEPGHEPFVRDPYGTVLVLNPM